jgi:hypothetical protein
MKTLSRLSAIAALTSTFALTALGTCREPIPGEIQTPPCASAQTVINDAAVLGETNTPPASDGVDVFSLAVTALTLVF